MSADGKVYLNVPTSDSEAARIAAQEAYWTGPRLVGLIVVTMAASLALLYFMSSTTSEVPFPNFALP